MTDKKTRIFAILEQKNEKFFAKPTS